MTPDVNVLVAAFLEGHPQQVQARRWLTQALAAAPFGTFVVLPMVAAGFLRVVTDRRIHSAEDSMGRAVAFLRSLLQAPGVSMPALGAEWPIFEALCLEQRLRGAIVADAWIAAAVMAHGLHLVTFDADFRRLLQPHELTLLIPENVVQEPRLRYLARAA